MSSTEHTGVTLTTPSLPKGGGAIIGMGESVGPVGTTGTSSLSIPVPVTPGRAHTPALSLTYSSSQGNGCFGIGWNITLPSIRLRTSKGVPRYNGQDEYLAPNNEVMVPEVDSTGQVVTTKVSVYAGKPLGQEYTVTRYFPRVMDGFERIEQWRDANNVIFWLLHGIDGQLLCLGKTEVSRIADPADTSKTGQWLLEESCTPNGEHICYTWKREDTTGVDLSGQEAVRMHTANRYLMRVDYGNVLPYPPLYAWGDVPAANTPAWLFTLVLDYGERTLDPDTSPLWEGGAWLKRQDPFSDYSLGYEVRTHRLCHQILMFHHFVQELGADNVLVKRLLLNYEETPVLSRLISAQYLAYESNGEVQSLTPLELTYTSFSPSFSADQYQMLPAFPGWNDGMPYQIVDLFGEGVPGILYQAGNDWRYQAPQRGLEPDSINYTHWQSLPGTPFPVPGDRRLIDITGDANLDWLVTRPGLAGYFTLGADRQWSNFIPLPAIPSEFFQASALLADLTGGGLSDLCLIGPRSIRLYPNQRENGFASPLDVAYTGGTALPVFGNDSSELVAFSDVLGSGQSHLVRVRHNGLECWPNLGAGRFGERILLTILDFTPEIFDPARVFLADIDGSGAADLIYAERDHFKVYFNHAGNGFSSDYARVPLPEGITYDQLSQVSFVDIQGTGTAALVLTIPHMAPRHFFYTFSAVKPYLLENTNNNMGASTTITYRSSAQEWLDQKQEAPQSVCQLPFPMPLVSKVVSLDEVSGNQLLQQFSYRAGAYSGEDREFRGFGYIEQHDTSTVTRATDTPPMKIRTWYHTGQAGAESTLYPAPFVDADMFALGATCFTTFTGDDDLPFNPEGDTRHQLNRALAGKLLRSEVYGLDGTTESDIPYTVASNRYQVRQIQPVSGAAAYSVTIPVSLEQLSVNYERIVSDPQVHHSVLLRMDEFCTPVHHVDIAYARRPQPPANPYPPVITGEQWTSSYDDSQQMLRITENLSAVHHLNDPQGWRLGLPYQLRRNVITDPTGYAGYPALAEGLSYESLRLEDGVLGQLQPRTLAGQTETYYFNPGGSDVLPSGTAPDLLARVHHHETAELDDEMLEVFNGYISDIATTLTEVGYLRKPRVLSVAGVSETDVWVIPQGYTIYLDSGGLALPFNLPVAQQSSLLVGPQKLFYDSHSCVVTKVQDATGLETVVGYDYRFMQPVQVTDPNNNQHQVLYDAAGRVIATSFWGTQLDPSTESPVDTGFEPLSQFDPSVAERDSIDAALANPAAALQKASSTILYEPFNWMVQISFGQLLAVYSLPEAQSLWLELQQQRMMMASGHLLSKGRRWVQRGIEVPALPESLRAVLASSTQSPVRSAVLTAQELLKPASSRAQQIMCALAYSDGFGRLRQSQQLTVPGMAFVVDASGQPVLDGNGNPLIQDTAPDGRWVVSGLVEYNNKGLPVRRYQPYFVDQPRYVNDTSVQQWGYADTLYYDPLNREREVVTALGYIQRQRYYPWFTVTEDMNDTLHEVLTK
ncbi:SpvB/TcaC N-terminal domain-containing protein [Yokenella regensburgei]|uniref:SpvB/TcaC N-terminal domain-containing protein n=1 Tax=Yokenella regensburgei TaxID=158877 RepID=UPI0031CE0309